MTNLEPDNHKAKFKAALEKKTQNSNSSLKNSGADDILRLQPSMGKKPRMFRRKSG